MYWNQCEARKFHFCKSWKGKAQHKKIGRGNKQKYDFFDDEDDKKNVKKGNPKIDETETIPHASWKRENDIDDSKTIVYVSPKRQSEDEIDEKIYKQPKLKTAVEIEKQSVQDKKTHQNELEPNKVDIQVAKLDIKKVQDVFEEVKKEKPMNVENFFIDDNDIFDSEEISNVDGEFIIDLINGTNFIVNTKKIRWRIKCIKNGNCSSRGKKLRRKSKCWLMATKRKKMRALKIISLKKWR